LICNTPLLRGADRLRRSLIPSLLDARRINESLGNTVVELFETARVYLPTGDTLPHEPWTLGITSGGDFYRLKGVIEALVAALHPTARLEATDAKIGLLDPAKSCQLRLDGRQLGVLGEVSPTVLKQFQLRSATTVAELDLGVLNSVAQLIPQYKPQSLYPSITRDLNFVVDNRLRWAELAGTVCTAAGQCLEQIEYRETFRDSNKDGPNKKRLLLTVTLRSPDRTLTNEEADNIREQIVTACKATHAASLLG
jgi:phenylalanyl-tRNA synthetase beta chain